MAIALVGVVALVTSVGCRSGEEAPASGSSASVSSAPETATDATVALRVATNEGPDTPTGVALTALREHALELSDGRVRLQAVWESAGNPATGWDQAVIETITDGGLELGFVPARAFDDLGVTTLQPLQTPFLVTSMERALAVASSPLADDLMRGLEDLGLTGLGLYPEDLRRLFSYDAPLTTPESLRGTVIRAPRSHMTAAVLATVGADVDDPSGESWALGVREGRLDGVESSLSQMASLGPELPPSTTTTGSVLFTKFDVLVVRTDAFAELDPEQRAVLREAAAALIDVDGLRSDEAAAAADFCATGGRIVPGRRADRRGLMAAMADPEPLRSSDNRALRRQLERLLAALPERDPAATCGGRD